MADMAWYVPAQIMNLSAIALVFLISLFVLSRHPEPYFRWWLASAGISAVGAVFGMLLHGPWGAPWQQFPLTATMIVASIALIASARRFRKMTTSLPGKWWLGLALIGACWALIGLGYSMELAAGPGFFALSISHLYFGFMYWPRRGEQVGIGSYLVGGSSILWGLHILDFPLMFNFAPHLFPFGYWLSGVLHFTLGIGMVMHLFEQSHEREQRLGRQLNQTNQDLLKTLSALTETRSQAELSLAVAREQEALVRQIIHDLRNSTQAISLIMEDLDDAIADQPGPQKSLAALERQVRFISNFLKEKLAWIVDRDAVPADGTSLAPAFDALSASMEPLIASKSQTFHVDGPPPVKLPISAVQFHQLLHNLLVNAHQHCPPGTTIRLWTAVSDGWATFYVADDGPGIPLEAQGQLGRATSRLDGSGVGLRNVHDLVTSAGGLFGVVSEPGKGSTFYVTLPLATWGLNAPGEPLPGVPPHVNEGSVRV